jgi:uncharacterized membrane protein YdjX (TVP38/TMEM64 family)
VKAVPRIHPIVVLLAAGALALLVWLASAYSAELRRFWLFLSDEQAVERFVAGLGALGPLALIAIGAIQIVIAPIPGYVVQLAAGYLYGPLWGGIYAAIGQLAGAMLAMWLARTFGRPLATRLIGRERLDRWETVTHSDSVVVWGVLLLGPIGDVPYALAGLARVGFVTIFLLTLLIRVPSGFLSTAVGSGVLPLPLVIALGVVLVVTAAVLLRYRVQVSDRVEQIVKSRIARAEERVPRQ